MRAASPGDPGSHTALCFCWGGTCHNSPSLHCQWSKVTGTSFVGRPTVGGGTLPCDIWPFEPCMLSCSHQGGHHWPGKKSWERHCCTSRCSCRSPWTRWTSCLDVSGILSMLKLESLVFLGFTVFNFFAAFFLELKTRFHKIYSLRIFSAAFLNGLQHALTKNIQFNFFQKIHLFRPFHKAIALQWVDQIKNGLASTQHPYKCSLVVYGFYRLGRCLRQKVNNTRFRLLCFIYIDKTPGLSNHQEFG